MIITDTEKLYSPINLFLRDNDMLEHYDGDYWRDDLPHSEARDFGDAIDLFLRRDRDTLDKTRGMMEYYHDSAVNGKVHSLFPTTEFHDGKLWCVAELTLTAPLTREEMAELKDWWRGQLSDGWGEGIEQREIKVDRGELYMEPWSSGGGFFLDTREQFEDRLGVRTSPDITIQPASLPPATEPLPDTPGRGYLIVVTDDSDYFVPNALHVQRDDSMSVCPDDWSAAEAAEADGIKLIYGMPDIADGIYIDTPENRAVITDYFSTRDDLLTQIAKKHCRFDTLETRKSDSLDFREVSVWGLKAALEEAYNAGIAHQRERTNEVDRLSEVGAVPEADAPDYEKLERQLRDRLADNYEVFKRDMLDTSKENLFYSAAEILPVQEAYAYFTQEHAFTESDVDFLLKLENPLELISDRWSDGAFTITEKVDAIFGEQERTLRNGGYTLMTDESAAAPESVHEAAVAGSGEKTSVLDRIKQHAKDARERPPASPDKSDRKKSEQEH